MVRLGPGDLGGDDSALLDWIVEAWKPYRDWLLGSRERGVEVAREWLRRDGSELSVTCVTALVEGDTHLGGFVAVGGDELPRRRRADLLWLLQRANADERRELTRRLEVSRDLFAPVAPDHCYLSKIGVLPEHRGRGLGGVVLDHFVNSSFEQGYAGVRLDVWSDNEPAVRLYRRRGFEPIAEADLAPMGIRYVGMTLERRTT